MGQSFHDPNFVQETCKISGTPVKILIVEDEEIFSTHLQKTLKDAGYVSDCVGLIEDAKIAVDMNVYDLIVLDRLLPDGDGKDLITYFDNSNLSRPPILLLTALGGVASKVEGLNAGADDYLAKPMDEGEFLARIRALIRRPNLQDRTIMKFKNVELDCYHMEVTVNGIIVPVSRIERVILEALMLRADRVVLRERLESAVYGFDDEFASNTLDSQISRLRKKLANAHADVKIAVTRGVGYRITAA